MFGKADAKTFRTAKLLRANMTTAEKHLWAHLNKSQLLGRRFKAQHPIGFYIVDFYCHSAKLVIEIDGFYHLSDEQKENDINRSAEIGSYGLKIIRFTNDDVLYDIQEVLKSISHYIIGTI